MNVLKMRDLMKLKMTLTSRVISLRSEALRWIRANPWHAGGLAIVGMALLAAALFIDFSATLSPNDVETVRRFAIRTRSQAVMARFNEAMSDGKLTVNETKAVIEVAKHAEPGYGLISDQGQK